jgi:multidrug efflux pump subunit AcrA (membrane-fusion protein)
MKNEPKKLYKMLSLIGGVVVLIVLILYMGGFFRTHLIEPALRKMTEREKVPPERIAYATVAQVPEWYEAVGTIRSKTETYISAQITGRILKVVVRPGDQVKQEAPLDNRELQARLDQARQGLAAARAKKEQSEQALVAAQAVLTQADANYNRIKKYFEQEAATKNELEKAEASYRQAKAGVEQAKKGTVAAKADVEQAKQVIEEARVALGYTKIVAPEAGEVARRLAEPGDLAWPGKSLLVLHAPGALRLEAHVREGLIKKVLPGSNLRVAINALNATLDGTVEEGPSRLSPASILACLADYWYLWGSVKLSWSLQKPFIVSARWTW